MKYDEDKVDELTLAILYLVSHGREEGCGARAWKGFDWDTLNRLHNKGLISNPIGKTKSVGMTEEGFLKSKDLFEKHFVNDQRRDKSPIEPKTACAKQVKTRHKREREQPDREDRILYEIVVDAYNDTERAMGWYYYLKDKMQMPFTARCRISHSISPLKTGQEVQVMGMAKESECMSEVFVLVKYGKTTLAVPLAQMDCLSEHEETIEAVADWHYWVARGYEY
ncbi:MAG: hypothetical protein FD159_1988 [Syntrophaceae bacterium]|nr:MAG: hypothetical protein FD159_1988 [Syntrophaceae bacterium]